LYVDFFEPNVGPYRFSFQKFYFRGLKLVITHREQANAIQARVKAGGEPLSRWESRFIRTNKTDLARYHSLPLSLINVSYIHHSWLRLVPFVAIVLLLEEVIPLIVLYAPGMLPSTCILASQRERIEAKRREKQRDFAETMRDVFSGVLKAGPTTLASSLPNTVSGIALCGQVTF
jgi:LETM1 and EF-hand domain-containing protein 1, mitochondrial